MTSRNFPHWINAYMEYCSFSEAQPCMHFWTAVATISGALRRRVWIDQFYFKWWANFYIIFVAPPGIVSKTTTISTGMRMLRKVPGIKFGPSAVTWQALVKILGECTESYQLPNGDWTTMSALSLESGEFGTLFDPQDKRMVDAFVSLWDGLELFDKATKGNGNDSVENPWINMIACTTPAWMAGNFPEYLIGGGFASRTVFVYIDEKFKFVPYPADAVPLHNNEMLKRLIQDLEQISLIAGEYKLTKEAKEWGTIWYKEHCKKFANLQDPRFGGYIARKQTHLHKLSIIIAASKSNELVIHAQDLIEALSELDKIEKDMAQVFSMIGRPPISAQAERLITFVHHKGKVSFEEAYRHVHSHFPNLSEFEGIVGGAVAAGYMKVAVNGVGRILSKGITPLKGKEEKGEGPAVASPI